MVARRCTPAASREIFSLASAKLGNQLAFKHSSRSRPLKLFTWPFCMGLPGWMWINWIFRSSHQPKKCREVSSARLSQRIRDANAG